MSKFLTMLVVSVVVVGLVGCGQSNERSKQPKTDNTATAENVPASHHEDDGIMNGKYEAELAKLSPEDQKLARKQKVCPVSGDPLGSMGKPYKVTVEGRDVFLCCPGCESALKKNPKKYLAKLPH